jgi:hypothetical protein
VTAEPAGEGEVIVTWSRAVRAENYRVAWRSAERPDAVVAVGLYSDRQVLITGLPRGESISISITPRNEVGDGRMKVIRFAST